MSALISLGDIAIAISVSVGVIGLWLGLSSRIKDNANQSTEMAVRLSNIENGLKDTSLNLSSLARSVRVLNHNSTAISTALVTAKILPPEILQALTKVDLED